MGLIPLLPALRRVRSQAKLRSLACSEDSRIADQYDQSALRILW